MDAGVIVAIVIAAIVVLALIAFALGPARERKREARRERAEEIRREAELRSAQADRHEAEAEEQAARARREQALAEEKAVVAERTRRFARGRHREADEVDLDPDADVCDDQRETEWRGERHDPGDRSDDEPVTHRR